MRWLTGMIDEENGDGLVGEDRVKVPLILRCISIEYRFECSKCGALLPRAGDYNDDLNEFIKKYQCPNCGTEFDYVEDRS